MTRKDAAFNRMAKAVANYLEVNGWTVLVVGPAKVQHWPQERKYNHDFVLRFMGGKREGKK